MRLAGVDGCPAGWIAAIREDDGAIRLMVVPEFSDLLPVADLIAVDMPIGLPDRAGPGGRAPESLVRPLLGPRQSSVFSVPSRAAVYAENYTEGRKIALATSDPPRSIAKQAFNIFPKIREIDRLIRAEPGSKTRIFETHPELAFTILNGGKPMTLPKTIKSITAESGVDERRNLLKRHGLPAELVDAKPPKGAKPDDMIDALVALLVAERIAGGEARAFPDEVVTDAHGIRIAIWA